MYSRNELNVQIYNSYAIIVANEAFGNDRQLYGISWPVYPVIFSCHAVSDCPKILLRLQSQLSHGMASQMNGDDSCEHAMAGTAKDPLVSSFSLC